MSKSLNDVIADIDKVLGKGTVQNFEEGIKDIEWLSSGSISLDCALGGGYPKGRIIEIYGSESSGKSTTAIHACVEVQKEGNMAAYLDFEHAFDMVYAQNLGLDTSKEKWLFSQPNCGEDGFTIIEKLLDVKEIGVIVIDSIAAMTPKAEIDGDFGDSKMGLHARLMSQGMRKLTGKVSKSNCVLYFINQIRNKIGVMFGSNETTTGGNAMKFYTSQRLEIKKFTQDKDSEGEAINIRSRIKIKKNKVAPPFRQCEIPIRFGEGFDKISELIDLAVESGIIKKSGSWFNYGDVKLGQGVNNVRTLLEDNPELFEEIELKVKINLGLIEE